MAEFCNLQIHVNGQKTFFVNEVINLKTSSIRIQFSCYLVQSNPSFLQKIISKYSGRLKKIIKQEKGKTRGIKKSSIDIDDFPGGADGFELVLRFCYNNGSITVTVSNVPLLHCCAIFLGMTERISSCNLLQQTETFLDGIFYWSWSDILVSLKSCESFFSYADSSGLVEKLVFALLAKIAQNSDIILAALSSSSSSSPETASGFRFSSPTKNTSPSARRRSSSRPWWFDDLSILPPKIIEKVVKSLGAYGAENNSLVLTKFLLHYLQKKTAVIRKGSLNSRSEYGGLAGTVAYGAIVLGKTAFSWRGLFWILRVVSQLGLSRDCRIGLERLIGGMLDQATLDDLLVCGHDGGVYDVNLVLRLIRVFVSDDSVSAQKMKKVGRLIDKYLGEVSPDQNLKVSKFLGVAQSLPDSARDCFDGVYRAIDIYLQVTVNYYITHFFSFLGNLNTKKKTESFFLLFM